jgi:thiol-disulfide isomerase/thioredoxin
VVRLLPLGQTPGLPRRTLLCGGLMACAGLAARAAPQATTPTAADEPGHEWRPWPAKRATPRLDLPALEGARWSLAAQRGRVVVANFWASWCGPCRAEMPSLELMAARHAADGLVVVCINYQESPATIRRFAESIDLSLPVLLDADGEAARAWTSRLFPSTVLIDRRGQPQGVLMGEVDWSGAVARARLAPLLAAR